MKNNKYDQISYCAKMIYEDKLISAGFVSYNNEGLSWYKVLNGCILQSVYLYSLFPQGAIPYGRGIWLPSLIYSSADPTEGSI